jgi:3'-phosphoadenosine 5'-phosphosulfate sulfotransferase (PAPS reductase)/FAD synthetase
MENKYSSEYLRQKQSLPLKLKIILSQKRIKEFYNYYNGNVYIAFSGGKDSTVLQHLVRSLYPDTPSLFCDTGLEYPEIKKFVKTHENITIIRPSISFREVLEKHGYPVISKRTARFIRDLQNPTENNKISRHLYLTGEKSDGSFSHCFKLPDKWRFLVDAPFKISDECCFLMKKKPFKKYEYETKRHPFVGVMASNSEQRKAGYLQTGCNSFNKKRPMSKPLGFWMEKDIWDYIHKFKIPYCNIYDKGESNTGCIFCMFGIHLDGIPNRFQRLERLHPDLHKYCINNLKLGKVLDYIGIPYKYGMVNKNQRTLDFLKEEESDDGKNEPI